MQPLAVSDDVTTPTNPTGTRWRRAVPAMLAGLSATAAMSAMVWTGAFGLNADLTVQNTGFSFATSKIVATDAAFGMTVVKKADGNRNALRTSFAGAALNGLCISKTESILGGVGTVTFMLTSGDGNSSTNEITASNVAFDVVDLQAKNAGIQLQGSVQIGQSTPDLTTVPGAAPFKSNPLGQTNSDFSNGFLENYDSSIWNGTANGGKINGQGFIGIDATQATLTTIYGKILQAQISGNINLPKLKITVTPGSGTSCETIASGDFASGYFPSIR